MGDLTMLIPSEDADICILEEPEHLNWYRAPGKSWRRAFKHVVGVVHTNYLAYASGYSVWAPVLTFMLRCVSTCLLGLALLWLGRAARASRGVGAGAWMWSGVSLRNGCRGRTRGKLDEFGGAREGHGDEASRVFAGCLVTGGGFRAVDHVLFGRCSQCGAGESVSSGHVGMDIDQKMCGVLRPGVETKLWVPRRVDRAPCWLFLLRDFVSQLSDCRIARVLDGFIVVSQVHEHHHGPRVLP